MEASYIKDLHHSYLVLPKSDDRNEEVYCVRMLQANSIKGIIKPDPRTIDNKVLYYFDITSKQSIEVLHSKNAIKQEEIRRLFISLADLIEESYEYLLNENNLLIEPEYIYFDLSTSQIKVCYLPSYNKDVRKQMVALIEHIMNKVEYKDKEAVLYVYNLYAVCRDEGHSFINLLSAIREKGQDKPLKNDNRKKPTNTEGHRRDKSEVMEEEYCPKSQPPVMMEKISKDSEQLYYPLSSYIYTGFCLIACTMVLIICINRKIIFKSYGNRIDYGKLMALILILFCIVGYLVKKIWDKKNRLTRIISEQEYVDPRNVYKGAVATDIKQSVADNDLYAWPDITESEAENTEPNKDIGVNDKAYNRVNNKIKERYHHEALGSGSTYNYQNSIVLLNTENQLNPTVLLNAKAINTGCCLMPENKELYDVIQINEYPFTIGKQKGNVDYCLDNEIISRYHVKITKEEDIYYITDLNSTNGTWLNENPLACYQRFEIKDGDELAIAGIKYLFKRV